MSARELKDFLSTIKRPSTKLKRSVADIGLHLGRRLEYTGAVEIEPQMNKSLLALRCVTCAAVQKNKLAKLVTEEVIRELFDITTEQDPTRTILETEKSEAYESIQILALSSLRRAGSEVKQKLSTRVRVGVNPANEISGYLIWRKESKNEHVIATVDSLLYAYKDAPVPELRLAAERLIGRGFTGATLIASLFRSTTSPEGKDALCQIINQLITAYHFPLFFHYSSYYLNEILPLSKHIPMPQIFSRNL